MDVDTEAWVTILGMRLVNRDLHVANMTVIILEFFQLLELEVSLVWGSKWNLSKCVYLILRYTPFGLMTIWLYYNSAPQATSLRTCMMLYNSAIVMMLFIVLCADVVLYLRVYALSMGSRVMKIVLGFNYLAVSVLCIAAVTQMLLNTSYVASPHILTNVNCFDVGSEISQRWVTVVVAGPLYNSAFTTILSLWYGLRLYLSMRPLPPGLVLVKIMYVDGAFYFASITAISAANIGVALLAPLQYRHLLPVPQAIAHSTLMCRMILHLRAASMAQSAHVPSTPSKLEFNIPPWSTSMSLSAFRATVGGRLEES